MVRFLLLLSVTVAVLWAAGWAQLPEPGSREHVVAEKEARTLVFHTRPDHAEVSLKGAGTMQFLGYSGGPITVPVPLGMNVSLRFAFDHEGYQRGHLEVDSFELKTPATYNFPEDGSDLMLLPNSMPLYLKDLASRHAGWASALVAVVLFGGIGWRRHFQRVVKQARRAA
ncbi:MAG TPA: hypothetical protein VGO93_26900, partial [Candidatus Xenobia bacterium]